MFGNVDNTDMLKVVISKKYMVNKTILCTALGLLLIGCVTNKPSEPVPTPIANMNPLPSKPKDEIADAVKAYAKKEGFSCGKVTGKHENQYSTVEVPKFEVACDGGKSKFVWVRYADQSTSVQSLL